MSKCVLGSTLLALVMAGVAAPALAQSFPERPVTLVVPFPPGGSTSLVARIVADQMSETIGQPVVLDNRGGAGGTVGTRSAASSEADGYTIMLTYTATVAVGPNLYEDAGYTLEDLAPIGRIGTTALTISVNPDTGVESVDDLITYIQDADQTVQFGSQGIGSFSHLAGELFAYITDSELEHIPYGGTGPMVTDLIAGRIDLGFVNVPIATAQAEGGNLRILAVAGPDRSDAAPDVPTTEEVGLPEYQAVLSYGLSAPAGTPPELIELLNRELNEALATDQVSDALLASDIAPAPSTPEEYGEVMQAESDTWGGLVESLGLTAE